ncbi:MAG TPA: DUF309 domain-containing protein [Candidatus Acidoferrales bacterium]|nr:DUF309 domain-containing protein [Candidatus Acidoferrales bacterium]
MDSERKLDLFRRGLDCFNRGAFFTCHELLEEIWLEEPEEEKLFYQGLIQIAAAFHHHQRGNRTGLESLLHAGVEKLRRYPPTYGGVDLAALVAALEPWLDALERRQPPDHLSLPRIEPKP